jgi:hypothetical protein
VGDRADELASQIRVPACAARSWWEEWGDRGGLRGYEAAREGEPSFASIPESLLARIRATRMDTQAVTGRGK